MKTNIWNPYERIAGTKALLWGLGLTFIACYFGYLGKIHFDGIMDIHIGKSHPYIIYVSEALINLVSISLFLYLASLILSKSKIRLIDIVGTQAFSRIPLILPAIFGAIFPLEQASAYFLYKYANMGSPVNISTFEIVGFIFFLFSNFLAIIWMIIWMYQAYKVSSNLSGTKAVTSFIISILLAEILSKLSIYFIIKP